MSEPHILIIEPDRSACGILRAYAVRGWRGASVQTVGSRLESVAVDRSRLNAFDVVLATCDFSRDGSSSHPAMRTLRALSADPCAPTVIVLAEHGGEYTAVQAIKAGAFDYIAKKHVSREQIVSAIGHAISSRRSKISTIPKDDHFDLFGYDIRKRLALNDTVSIHIAFSAERNEEVVIKVLHRGRGVLSLDEHFQRFVDEFKILFDIDDPAVAEIYDFRVTEKFCYIAMEYFRQGHLGLRLNDGPLPAETALRLTTEIAQSLSIIHTAGVVHRDLKPGNIMLREDGSAALIDFGISQSTTLIRSSQPRAALPTMAGTPYYISPEQITGEATNERTDLYSLGVILFQMLSGRKPYVGETFEQIVEQHKRAPVPHLPEAVAQYQDLIDRLMAKEPPSRVANARELIELIERKLGPSAHARSSISTDTATSFVPVGAV